MTPGPMELVINVYHHTNSRKLNLVVKILLEPAHPELSFINVISYLLQFLVFTWWV